MKIYGTATSLVFFLALVVNGVNAAEPYLLAYDVHTTESIIEASGVKYRKVEYKGDVFYLRLLEAETSAGDLQLSCGSSGKLDMENQVLISTQITKRSSLFIEGLKQTCKQTSGGNHKVDIDPNIQIGFIIDDSKKALLKNKKVYWNPANSKLGFGAEIIDDSKGQIILPFSLCLVASGLLRLR